MDLDDDSEGWISFVGDKEKDRNNFFEVCTKPFDHLGGLMRSVNSRICGVIAIAALRHIHTFPRGL